jgi:hypothetical protein
LYALILKAARKPLPQTPPGERLEGAGLVGFVWQAPFLLIACFLVVMMAVIAALPAHMVSLLQENGLSETWVIAMPASIGVIEVLGRLLLYYFEHHFDLHAANRVMPMLIPLGLIFLLVDPMLGEMRVWGVVCFVVLFGLGNGMVTIVKGAAIAQ